MKTTIELGSVELDALFEPPHANAKTLMKPIVPVDKDGNPGIGIAMDSSTRKSGLVILERSGLLQVTRPDGRDFSVFMMRRGEDEEERKVHVTNRPAPSLSVRRDSDGTITPAEVRGFEITDEEGFMEFWEKVAFCAVQKANIESITPL